MTKVLAKDITKKLTKNIKRTLSDTSIRAIAISLLFIFSGIGASFLINPASATPNSAAPSAAAPSAAAPVAAATPLTQAEANWEYPNGNAFGQDYNPQAQINSSNLQDLGLSWLFPLPTPASSLSTLTFTGTTGVGVDPLIVNGTAIVMTEFDEVIAFNVANGDVLWTFLSPLAVNQTLGLGTGGEVLHAHDGTEQWTTGTFASGVSGPTFWFQGVNFRVYAINANTGKEELNFSDYTGLSMVAGNGPSSNYAGQIGAANIVINQQLGILVSSMTSRGYSNTARGYFAGWNLDTNPPSMKWITYTTPPQPNGNLPLNPYFAQQLIANMTGAETFYPGENGSTNGYTTPWEVAGGVLHNVNDDIVVNWKGLSSTQLNATLYNDWGYSPQTAQCQAISGGASTGGTGAGWGAQWLVGSGQTAGMFIVATNNADPYSGPCYPGPDLWSASTLALNATTGQMIWGFQANAHDTWDYDCSWYQGLGNETINGVNTEVVLKTCKNGYLYELNAVTGNLIWAWSPPAGVVNPGPARCPVCYMWNPLNESQMHFDFPSAMTNCAPTFTLACITGPQPDFFGYPPALAGFEDEQAFDPATNQIYATSHLVPAENEYVPQNTTNYGSDEGFKSVPCAACGVIADNASVWDINAANGQVVWNYLIPNQGFRGQTDVSGNVVFLTLSSADILMLNAQTGKLVRDYYIGAPMDVGVSIGASDTGQEYILVPVGTCSFEAITTCPGTSPGDILALAMQTGPALASTSTTTVTTTTTLPGQTITTTTTLPGGQVVTTTITGTASTVTLSGSGTVTSVSTTTVTSSSNSTALYGVAAVAVIFIIATGYLAMTRGRKPAS